MTQQKEINEEAGKREMKRTLMLFGLFAGLVLGCLWLFDYYFLTLPYRELGAMTLFVSVPNWLQLLMMFGLPPFVSCIVVKVMVKNWG